MPINWKPTTYTEISPPQVGQAAEAVDAEYARRDRRKMSLWWLAAVALLASVPLCYFLSSMYAAFFAASLAFVVLIYASFFYTNVYAIRETNMERGTPSAAEIRAIEQLAAKEPELATVLRDWSAAGLLLNNRTEQQILAVSELPSIATARYERDAQNAARELAQRFNTESNKEQHA